MKIKEMEFVFWQNVLSIHQSAFLRALAEDHSVTLVVEQEVSESRKKVGWSVPDFGKTQLVIAPEEDVVDSLLHRKEATHVFTGIKSFPLASRVFEKAARQGLKIGVILEPYNWLGVKGKLRFLKYTLLRLKYGSKIDFLLTIGDTGKRCYKTAGFPLDKMYDWGYFTEKKAQVTKESTVQVRAKAKIIFIGTIDDNKNSNYLVDVCLKNKDRIDGLTILGTGPLVEELKNKIKGSSCHYLGVVPNAEVAKYILASDVLVLPSKYDGWGAVVNEALMIGKPVVVSDHSGASVLIKENRGAVFSISKNNLEEVLLSFVQKLPYTEEKQNEIKAWSERTITGEAAANYFSAIVQNVYHKAQRPIAPWLKSINKQ